MHIHHQGRLQSTRPEAYKVRQGVGEGWVEASLSATAYHIIINTSHRVSKGLCKALGLEEP